MAVRTPYRKRRSNLTSGVAAIAAGALAIFVTNLPASAQQLEELRGAIGEQALHQPPLAGDRQTVPTAPARQANTQARTIQSPPDGLTEEFFDAGAWDEAADQRDASPLRAAPEIEELPATNLRTGSVDGFNEDESGRIAAADSRVAPIEIGERRQDDDPYAPLGLRIGSFTVTPTLEQGIGYTSNALSSAGGGSSVFSETGLRLNAVSDWSRHQASIDADINYRRSLSGAEIDELTGGGRAALRHDLPNGFTALYELGYRVAPEDAASPFDFEESDSRPLRQTIDGAATLARDVGKLRLSLRGSVLRETFDDAILADGSRLSQSDRNSTLYSATLRTGYALSPALTPFVEAEAGRRIHDNCVDSCGYERSANRFSLRGGLEFDISEKMQGEIAAGWIAERPDDDRIASVSAPYLAAELSWSPQRGTTVALDGTTMVEASGGLGDDASVFYATNLRLTHDILHNLTGTALLGLDWRDYAGSNENETILRAEAGLTWWLNRNLGIDGRLRHVTMRSDQPNRGYRENSAYLGVIMQR